MRFGRHNSLYVHEVDQVSKNRYHNEIKLAGADEVDDNLRAWLRSAYDLE